MTEQKQPAPPPAAPKPRPWLNVNLPSSMTLREVMTNVFAAVIVGLWAFAVGRQIMNPTELSLQHATAISALLGPILGAVLGLYFGANAGERLAERADKRTTDVKSIGRGAVDDAREEVDQTRQLLVDARDEIRRLRAMTQGGAAPETPASEAPPPSMDTAVELQAEGSPNE